MCANLLDDSVQAVMQSALATAETDVIAVAPSEQMLRAIVDVVTTADRTLPPVAVLVSERVLKLVTDDFLAASRMADLVDDGALSLSSLSVPADNSLLVWPDGVYAIVSAGDQVAALAADDESFINAINTTYRTTLEGTAAVSLRTPPLSAVEEALIEDISEQCHDDFISILTAAESIGAMDKVDEVVTSLLAAARNDVLLYDISRWGEDVGVASKATFSRAKSRLENAELIRTEKVPIDVGRPRLRLTLPEEYDSLDDSALVTAVAESL
ncbi:transcriptional regulator TbsP domain-containing protein [Halalkalirubrum salinum]|uniref:transcriptional regulator TbsP domain-containing protein n=1 Tax=Halalkalirubrum salinum TaxID=2563889 RepID=UPI0010FB4659|nr:DUF5821 family protein [Halalkalirubrum salinum]